MSLAELKEQLAGLPAKDRLKLATFLADLEEAGEAEFRVEVDRRMQAMDRGAKMTMEEFEARDQALREQGR
jgi:hypothetical protein